MELDDKWQGSLSVALFRGTNRIGKFTRLMLQLLGDLEGQHHHPGRVVGKQQIRDKLYGPSVVRLHATDLL